MINTNKEHDRAKPAILKRITSMESGETLTPFLLIKRAMKLVYDGEFAADPVANVLYDELFDRGWVNTNVGGE